MTIAETERDPPYAKIPHALILVHPAPHVRLYGVLHYLAWNHLTFEVGDLARMMGDTPDRAVAERTIYRWLDALAEAGWIAYDRKPGRRGLGERITLYTSPNGRAQTSDPQIRGLPKPLTPGSEVSQTSDPQIRGLPKPLTPGSEVSQTSDPQIRGTPDLPRSNAAKNAPQISGFRSPDSDPTIHHPATPSAGGGGDDAIDLSVLTVNAVPALHTPATPDQQAPPAADGTYPESRRLLLAAGARSMARVAQAARLRPDLVRTVLARGEPIGRALVVCSDAAETPDLAAAIAAGKEHPYDQPRPVGSRGGRAQAMAAQPAPHRPERPAEPDISESDLAAYEESIIAQRRGRVDG